MTTRPDPTRDIQNLDGESLGISIAAYDAVRPKKALAPVHTLCHAPFAVMDLGPQGQVTTCNHFHRFIGNLNSESWLDIFRGEDWTRLRQNMLNYRISEMDCRHCSRQIRSGHPGNAFAQEHFDVYPAETETPQYPTVIIFRLSNVCNLMCVMCNGTLSHRIRKERENLPPLPPPPYGEQFFQEMEETLPHVKYVEFYGGEPFLVKEHLRILDILEKTGAKTEIYVNTNGTAITPKIKGYIERLNFIKIAVSVDAIYETVHVRQRIGIKHEVCMENLQWMLDLRQRKKIWIGLNTTETRFNWYHLPIMYEWAAGKDVYIHINTCLHPSDTTLYDLPTEELSYIGDYFDRWRTRLGSALDVRGNRQSYGHLEAMVRDELMARKNGTKRPNPYPTDRDPIHGGLMSVPELKCLPIDSPAAARVEIEKVQQFEAWDYALRMAKAWREAIAGESGEWLALLPELDRLVAKAEPLAAQFAGRRSAADDQRAIRAGWKLEQQGRFAEVIAALDRVGAMSEHLPEAELLRARAHRRMGRFDLAQETLHRAFALAPTDPAAFVELAWFCFDTGDVEAGRGHARRARDLAGVDPGRNETAAWAHVLGALAVRAGDKAEAAEALRALERVQPNAAITSDLREAIDNIEVARDRLAIQDGWRLERGGKFEEAIAVLAAVTGDSPLAYDATIPRSRALRRMGRVAEAKTAIERAAADRPDRPEAWVERAWLCYDTGLIADGMRFAKQAASLASDPVPSAHALAVLAIAGNHGADAVEALKRIHAVRKLAARPAQTGGVEAFERDRAAIARAWQHEAKGEYREALACVADIGGGSPAHRDALVVRTRAQRRRGDIAAALRTMALSIAIEPVQLEALIELAWHYYDVKDHGTGLRYAQCAMALSEANGNPIGVVGWAHPLGVLAVAGDQPDVAAEAVALLQSARSGEDRADVMIADIAARADQHAAARAERRSGS